MHYKSGWYKIINIRQYMRYRKLILVTLCNTKNNYEKMQLIMKVEIKKIA